MSKYLFFDTETSGKSRFDLPATHPSQPNLVQLCAILQGSDGKIVAEINLIIRPEGFSIPAEATAIHGIPNEMALDVGIRLPNASFIFRDLVERCDMVVAHNTSFDILVMTKALAESEVPELPWSRIPQRCTMKTSTAICKIQGPRGFKWPKLEEAHRHFFGTGVEGAHDASADTHACRRIHNHLVTLGAFR